MTELPKDSVQYVGHEIPAALEAVLFASGDPVSAERLCEITGLDHSVLSEELSNLADSYAQNPASGLMLRKLENDYLLCTKPETKPALERFFRPRSRPPMSQATYETLAVVAYNQPVTRAQVEAVRGVSSDSIITRLLERGWIQECGTLDAPGRPALFETTQQFLFEFGIDSIAEMPAMDLMMYRTIRDLEESLEEAAGVRAKRQMSLDHLSEEQGAQPENE